MDKMAADCGYYKFFYEAVTAGIACGLSHPVEWMVNIHRLPGGSMHPDYYKTIESYLPRALVDIFKNSNMRLPKNADEILNMCNLHYPEGHICRGYFDFLGKEIEKYVKEVRK